MVASVAGLSISASGCGSLVHHDNAPPAGLVAKATPWAGTFRSNDLPSGIGAVTSLSCPVPDDCFATASTVGTGVGTNGATVIATRNGGATWSLEAVPPTAGYLSAISCPDISHCVAAGQSAAALGANGLVFATEDRGRVWTAAPPIPGITDVGVVTCLAGGRCLAVGASASGAVSLVSTTSGSRWQPAAPLPTGTAGATSVSCAGAGHCWVTGQVALDLDHVAGTVAETADFGAHWTSVPVPPGTGVLGGISCATAGASASLPYGPAGSGPATAPGAAAVSGSTSGTPTSAPGGTPTSTSSPSPSTTTTVPGVPGYACTAVGSTTTAVGASRSGRGVILVTGDGGSTWTAARVPSSAAAFATLSCPRAGECAAVGTTTAASSASGVAVLTGSGRDPWRKPAVLEVPQPLTAVSCPARARCVMGGVAVTERLAATS